MDISQKPIVILSSGPITLNPKTKAISVEILNISLNDMRKVIIEIKNWTNNPHQEFAKFGFLFGEQINPAESGDAVRNEKDTEANKTGSYQLPIQFNDLTMTFPPIMEPFIFTIPAQNRLSILAFPPSQMNPCVYEVRLYLFNPVNLIYSSFGLSADGVPQEGNTILSKQFFPHHPIPPFSMNQIIPQRPF
ncbi:hypothetical protein ACIFOT_05640 [Neobacillus sp. NRS-1170]|uniref:hypothetical protein n=1 Tax=Neobacillus sp. NRS-1170 TaxID=3233898 RepID=UPI003D2B4B7B